MGLYYKVQQPVVLIGSKTPTNVRTGVALTTSYETDQATRAVKTLAVAGASKLNLDILYTMGATETANSIEVKVEASPDEVNFYRIANDTTVAGVSTLTAREFTFVGTDAAAATIGIFLDVAYKFVKVSIKETGVVTNAGNVFVEATISGK